jgi:hypothetical protein
MPYPDPSSRWQANEAEIWRWLRRSLIPLMLLLYVCGYFTLSERGTVVDDGATVRLFGSNRLAIAYFPLGWLETNATGRGVVLGTDGVWHCFQPSRWR